MISNREIKEHARQFGVPTSSIERDYAQNWLLSSLYPIHMVLKGGTGIRKVYFKNYRFSDDLDFTLLPQYDSNTITDLIQNALTSVREETGILFSDEVKLNATRTGLRGTVYFQSSLTRSSSHIGIHLDLTDPAHERIILPFLEKEIIHPYSDGFAGLVKVYTLEEMMAEKIRSLFQRTRARDLYDVCHIAPHVETERILPLLREKCTNKGVIPFISQLNDRREEFSKGWKASLEHQIKPLPDFEKVFEEVLVLLEQYTSNGTN